MVIRTYLRRYDLSGANGTDATDASKPPAAPDDAILDEQEDEDVVTPKELDYAVASSVDQTSVRQ